MAQAVVAGLAGLWLQFHCLWLVRMVFGRGVCFRLGLFRRVWCAGVRATVVAPERRLHFQRTATLLSQRVEPAILREWMQVQIQRVIPGPGPPNQVEQY